MAQPQSRSMLRKPILMPPSMIDRIDKIAKKRNVSFAEVIRDAVDAWDDKMSSEDAAILEALADTMIRTTQEVVKKIEELESRLDETHAMIEEATSGS